MASDASARAPRAEGAMETDSERQPFGRSPNGESPTDGATRRGRSPDLPLDEKTDQGTGRAVDSPELRRYLARLETLDNDIADLRALRASVVREFKGRGFEPRALAEILRERRIDADKLADHRAIVDLYRDAIGDGPLFEAIDAETDAQLYHAKMAREKAQAVGKATERAAGAVLAEMDAKAQREERSRSSDERVEVTTPKGRKAALKASDPIAAASAAASGGAAGTDASERPSEARHSEFCDCAGCAERRAASTPAAKRAEHEAKAAASTARVDAIVGAAAPAVRKRKRAGKKTDATPTGRIGIGRLPPEPEPKPVSPRYTPKEDAARIERNRRAAAPKRPAKKMNS